MLFRIPTCSLADLDLCQMGIPIRPRPPPSTPVRTCPPHPVLCTAVIHTSDSHPHPPTPNLTPLIPTNPNLLQHNRRSDRSGAVHI